MFFTLLSKTAFKSMKGNRAYFFLYIVGVVFYIILHYFLNSSKCPSALAPHKKYIYYILFIDAVLAYMLFNPNKKNDVDEDKKNGNHEDGDGDDNDGNDNDGNDGNGNGAEGSREHYNNAQLETISENMKKTKKMQEQTTRIQQPQKETHKETHEETSSKSSKSTKSSSRNLSKKEELNRQYKKLLKLNKKKKSKSKSKDSDSHHEKSPTRKNSGNRNHDNNDNDNDNNDNNSNNDDDNDDDDDDEEVVTLPKYKSNKGS